MLNSQMKYFKVLDIGLNNLIFVMHLELFLNTPSHFLL